MSEGPGDEAEKSFEPTQKRLDEARRRGEVPLSADLVTAASYGGFLVAAWTLGAGSLLALGALLAALLAQAAPLSDAMFRSSPQPLWGGALSGTVAALWPWFALPASAALLALLAQNALVFAPEKLQPKASRLSPLTQFRQRFGADGLMEFAKGLLKVGLYGGVLGLTLARATPELVGTAAQSPKAATLALLGVTLDLLVKVALLALVLGSRISCGSA
jgi:flagellar biosynthetic protein FlhB